MSKEVPLAVLVAQIKLYVQHMGPQLESVCGKVGSTEQERWLKTINVKMGREELVGNLAAVRGTLTIVNGVNMIKSSLMCTMGVCETAGPYAGLALQGLTSELAAKQDEIELIATQMTIDNYEFYSQKMKPEYQMFLLCSSSAFACHNRNIQIQAQHAQETSQQPVNQDMESKYSEY